jgi:prevent-host-death family protein
MHETGDTMSDAFPMPFRMPTSRARDRLSDIVLRVQERGCHCVLTRHGRPVAAVVSMDDLDRIDRQEIIGRIGPGGVNPGQWWHDEAGRLITNAEAAEHVQKVQYDRLAERNALAMGGLEPVPGGELEVEGLRRVEPPEGPAEAEPEAPRAEAEPAPAPRRGWLARLGGR